MKIYDNDYYYEDERLYSTGNDDLDILLERAFSDGYYFAQKEFFNLSSGIKTIFKRKDLPTKAGETVRMWKSRGRNDLADRVQGAINKGDKAAMKRYVDEWHGYTKLSPKQSLVIDRRSLV